MKRLVLCAFAVACAQVSVAQTGLLGDVSPIENTLEDTQMARVVTRVNRPQACLASVAVTLIDGEKAVVSAQGFSIEPGVHSLNGRAFIGTDYCPLPEGYDIGPAADLEVDFEAGKTYYVAYDHKAADPLEWRLVVWRIEDPGRGTPAGSGQ